MLRATRTTATPWQATHGQAPTATKSQRTRQITVTAQKRTENLQEVPISIDVLEHDKLEQMNVPNFVDYVKLLPSVSSQRRPARASARSTCAASPAAATATTPARCRASASISTSSRSPPSAARSTCTSTISQRVEALSGPQGTLYGASSESGTIRIITNKPDPSAFSASVSAEVNTVDHGGIGYVTEGFVNVPLTDWMALRVVGWSQAGRRATSTMCYGTRTYPTSGITVDNAERGAQETTTLPTRAAAARR